VTAPDLAAESTLIDLGSALVSDCLERSHAMGAKIVPLSGSSLVGRAFPVEVLAGDNATLHHAVATAPRGSVLVVDAQGGRSRAVWGSVLTSAAMARGIRGIVVDGCVRDLAEIRRLRWPAYGLGTCPAGPHKAGGGRIGFPVSVGGVVVGLGDVVVADLDGVTVIPADRLDEVTASGVRRKQLEDGWLARIAAGSTTVEFLGLSDVPSTRAPAVGMPNARRQQ
jgi:4-hydroxy-4-methyl-2-oxoglutarate aldolase